MIRALSTTCLALLVVAFTSTQALAKPTIAVLGLEVVDPSGTPNPQDTQIAKDLTDGLRARAKVGTGAFQLAPGSDKELIDLKLMNNCDNEAPACMSAIGTQLGADVVIFGKLQKESKGNYQVTLKVLDVGKKSISKSAQDVIPTAEAGGAALQGWAKKIYSKLTGENSAGVVVIKLQNAERGTILIDGQEKGNITNGSGQITGLPEGKYKLAVESDGFRRYDRDITISAGQTNTIPVELEKSSGGSTNFDLGNNTGEGPGTGTGPGEGPIDHGGHGGKGSALWKGVFVGSLVVAAGGGGWWAYNWRKGVDAEDTIRANGGFDNSVDTQAKRDAIESARSDEDAASKQTWVGGVVLGVGVGVAAIAFYKGFVAKNDSSESSSQSANNAKRGKRTRKDRFVVTPIVSPNGGGATVRLDW